LGHAHQPHLRGRHVDAQGLGHLLGRGLATQRPDGPEGFLLLTGGRHLLGRALEDPQATVREPEGQLLLLYVAPGDE
jgi:hypothetical protein